MKESSKFRLNLFESVFIFRRNKCFKSRKTGKRDRIRESQIVKTIESTKYTHWFLEFKSYYLNFFVAQKNSRFVGLIESTLEDSIMFQKK
ncbi:hypothetical protein LEP1GSC127_4688 [Leptospira kirschneri str. 200801925]|nr:hypothetical protein LEP1GSC127_4688 [Leptospira kirschneri str. 200801925]